MSEFSQLIPFQGVRPLKVGSLRHSARKTLVQLENNGSSGDMVFFNRYVLLSFLSKEKQNLLKQTKSTVYNYTPRSITFVYDLT